MSRWCLWRKNKNNNKRQEHQSFHQEHREQRKETDNTVWGMDNVQVDNRVSDENNRRLGKWKNKKRTRTTNTITRMEQYDKSWENLELVDQE